MWHCLVHFMSYRKTCHKNGGNFLASDSFEGVSRGKKKENDERIL